MVSLHRLVVAAALAMVLAMSQPVGAVFENYSGDCTGSGCDSFLHNVWNFVHCQGSGRIFPFC